MNDSKFKTKAVKLLYKFRFLLSNFRFSVNKLYLVWYIHKTFFNYIAGFLFLRKILQYRMLR